VARDPKGVKIRAVGGLTHNIHSEEIVSLERQRLSIMPEGLDKLLSEEQLGDLLAFLRNLR
jgi:putative heme-binding domain-containing protein